MLSRLSDSERRLLWEPPDQGAEGDPCVQCKARLATVYWCSGPLDYIHNYGFWWCEVCAVEAQLDHARESAARIPELEAKLNNLKRDDRAP